MPVRALLVALAALLLWPAADGSAPTSAKKAAKTVTRTFSSDDAISIPSASGGSTAGLAAPFPATIQVKGLKKGKVKDVNLTLVGLTHASPANIDVILAKGNRSATVMSDAGLSIAIMSLILTLDDEASAPLPQLTQIQGGRFQPINYGIEFNDDSMGSSAPVPNGNMALSTFDGIEPDGAWQVFIRDDSVNNTGSIDQGWSLQITAKLKNKKKH